MYCPALLKNTGAESVIVWQADKVLCARGNMAQIGLPTSLNKSERLKALAATIVSCDTACLSGHEACAGFTLKDLLSFYLQVLSEISRLVNALKTAHLYVQPVGSNVKLLLLCVQPLAFSPRFRMWFVCIAERLGNACVKMPVSD